MTRRKTSLLVAAATALSTVLVTAPAPAVAAEEDLTCRSAAVGVLPNGKMLKRTLENGRQLQVKTTRTELPFRPRTMGYAGWEEIDGGLREYYLATARDGRPRFLAVTEKDARRTMSARVLRFATTGFTPRLMGMGHVGSELLALEGPVLRQYKIRSSDNGPVLRNPRVAKRNMDRLKTLSWYSRQRVGGVKTDIYLATTKAGALLQIRVPVRNPGNTRVITVKRTGFKPYTGLSLSYCNDTPATALIVGVNARGNLARWFTLERQLAPKAQNLTNHGLAAEGRNWKLRPVL
ncbi:MAG TPA: hypothetical protein VFZ64_12160 [Nocardioidaceae bacterium]